MLLCYCYNILYYKPTSFNLIFLVALCCVFYLTHFPSTHILYVTLVSLYALLLLIHFDLCLCCIHSKSTIALLLHQLTTKPFSSVLVSLSSFALSSSYSQNILSCLININFSFSSSIPILAFSSLSLFLEYYVLSKFKKLNWRYPFICFVILFQFSLKVWKVAAILKWM